MDLPPHSLRCLNQGRDDAEISDSGVLDWHVRPRRPFSAHGRSGHDDVAHIYVGLEGARSPDPYEGLGPDPRQLLHDDGRRGAPDAGVAGRYPNAVDLPSIGDEPPVLGDPPRLFEERRDFHNSPRVSGEQDALCDVPNSAYYVRLYAFFHRKHSIGF